MSSKFKRTFNYESLEPRLVMSAQALTDFVADLQPNTIQQSPAEIDQRIETLIESGGGENSSNDVAAIREQYNLSGSSQTVAVIDSGIAFDHLALGGGFGEDYRVVGGYDFAENDDNPYDDGPLGLHGTHVSGIIGGSSDEFSGVAPGVDLVSLRVFDDNGGGEIEYVERALRWVHENRNAFENPITTVNLSIGTNWNADTVPEAAQLEDEFALLEAEGIFISVAAGNLFNSFNETGLSYPAASPFVVPVASHGADGQISDFSQRNDRVLVAPGEGILSTVPDHVFRGSETDGFARTSGTSQAAPYVAGASALLREAFQSVGQTDIDQDFLYEHFLDTADIINDDVTGGSFHQINLERAIETVLGDSSVTFTNAGTINGGEMIGGSIDSANESDHFTFRAGQTGSLTLAVNASGSLAPEIGVAAGAQVNGNVVTIDVIAGQEYDFSVGSQSGVGSYQIDIELIAEAQPNTVASGTTGATAGTAVAAIENGTLLVRGTAGDDNIVFDNGDSIEVRVNDQNFTFDAADVDDILVIGGGGEDSIEATLSNFDRATLRSNRLDAFGPEFDFTARGFEAIHVSAGDSLNRVAIFDSAGDDSVTASFESTTISGDGFQHTATGFSRTAINAVNGGVDRVDLDGTEGDDRFVADGDRSVLRFEDQRVVTVGFESVAVNARGGEDFAIVRDSVGSDRYVLSETNFTFAAADYDIDGFGFERITAESRSGYDIAVFEGGDATESLIHREGRSRFSADGYLNVANGFDQVNVNANGEDSARIFDSAGNDTFATIGDFAEYRGGGQILFARGFSQVDVFATAGGHDTANLVGSAGNDRVSSFDNTATLNDSGGARYQVADFENVIIDTGAGLDLAELIGSEGVDLLASLEDGIQLQTGARRLQVLNAEESSFDGRGGVDEVLFSDFGTRDLLEGFGDKAIAYLNSQQIEISNIEFLEARTNESSNYDIAAVDYLFLLDGDWQRDAGQ